MQISSRCLICELNTLLFEIIERRDSDMDKHTDEVRQYWLRLYPEMKTASELDDYMVKIFGKNLLEKEAEEEIYNEFHSDSSFINTVVNKNEIKDIRFYYFMEPILSKYAESLNKVIDCSGIVKNKKKLLKELTLRLAAEQCDYAFQTIVFEIQNAKKAGILLGKTSNERYEYYTNFLLKDDVYRSKLYKKYKYLIRLLEELSGNFVRYVEEILINTEKYLTEIEKTINESNAVGKLDIIEISKGDTHFKGKSVAKLVFENGQVLFYKPRDCKIDCGYQKILDLLNQCNVLENRKFRLLKIYSTTECAWFENISHDACENRKQIVDYYIKLGGIMAIMYFFGASDLHYENVIASKDDPMIIDLESIFGSHLKQNLNDEKSGFYKAVNVLRDSVMSTGILPNRLRVGESKDGFDASGLNHEEKQVSPVKSMMVMNDKTDEIKLKMGNTYLDGAENTPKFYNENVNVKEYLDDLINGFEMVYMWVINNKQKFVETVEREFGDTRIRVVLKPTFLYAQISLFSKHPYFMTSKSAHEMFVARIGIYSENNDITKSEIRTLNRGEIPYFYIKFESESLFDDSHNELKTKLVASPLEKTTCKIKQASVKDLELQKKIIKMSFFHVESSDLRTNVRFMKSGKKIDSSKYIQVAKKIGDWLCANAIEGINEMNQSDAVWIGSDIAKADVNDWAPEVSDLELYNGNAGVALFLLYLGKATNNKKYIEMAVKATNIIICVIENGTLNYNELLGAFNGIGSYIYIIGKLYKETNDKHYLKVLDKALDLIPEKINESEEADLVAGTCGMLATLISVINEIDEVELQQKIKPILNQIYIKLEQAFDKHDSIVSYSGFAHGVAGCIAYLYKLYMIEKDSKVYGLFKKMLDYERKVFFDNQRKVWITKLGEEKYSKAWCHGFPGILLEKVILKSCGYSDDYLDAEIELAINKTIDECIGNNVVYCHGDIGNLDILLYASQVLEDSVLNDQCRETYDTLFELIIKKQWNADDFAFSKCVGLMMGMAGIGMSLLRFDQNIEVDNLLALE